MSTYAHWPRSLARLWDGNSWKGGTASSRWEGGIALHRHHSRGLDSPAPCIHSRHRGRQECPPWRAPPPPNGPPAPSRGGGGTLDRYAHPVRNGKPEVRHAPPVTRAGRVPKQSAVTALPGPVGVRIAGKVSPLPPREGEGTGEGGRAPPGCRMQRWRSVHDSVTVRPRYSDTVHATRTAVTPHRGGTGRPSYLYPRPWPRGY